MMSFLDSSLSVIKIDLNAKGALSVAGSKIVGSVMSVRASSQRRRLKHSGEQCVFKPLGASGKQHIRCGVRSCLRGSFYIRSAASRLQQLLDYYFRARGNVLTSHFFVVADRQCCITRNKILLPYGYFWVTLFHFAALAQLCKSMSVFFYKTSWLLLPAFTTVVVLDGTGLSEDQTFGIIRHQWVPDSIMEAIVFMVDVSKPGESIINCEVWGFH